MNLALFPMQYPLIFNLGVIAIFFIILVKSANLLVIGIDKYAKKEGLSDYLVGLLIVSLTASTPEFVSSLTGLVKGDSGIIFGTILGSNIAGITLVLGVLALVGRNLKLENKILKRMEVLLFFMIMLPFFLGADGLLSRLDGLALVLAYFGYATMLWVREKETGHMKKNVKVKLIWKESFIFIGALAVLFISSMLLVDSSIKVANILNIPTFVMAVVVLGIAASLPDLFVGVKALLEGDAGVGIGNSLGSMVVKALLFLGVIALMQPLVLDINQLWISIFVTILSLGIVMYLSEKGMMNWKHGLMLLLVYILYLTMELVI